MNKDLISSVLRLALRDEDSVKSIIPLSQESSLGNKSRLWFLKDKHGNELVLKKYPSWVQKTDLVWIHEYMQLLHKVGFPLCVNKGETIEMDNYHWAIYEYADGDKFDKHNYRHFEDMAIKLNWLHNIGSHLKIRARDSWSSIVTFRPDYFLIEKIEKEMPPKINPVKIKKIINNSCRVYENLRNANSGNTIPIHGDFITKNMKFTATGISKVFDFGNARTDYLEADLALTLNDLCEVFKTDDWRDVEYQFLDKYRHSNFKSLHISPRLICVSGLAYFIRECLYLSREYMFHPEEKLILDLDEKIKSLELFMERLPSQSEFLGRVFKNSQ